MQLWSIMGTTLITIIGIGFIFLMTSLGSGLVFVFNKSLASKPKSLLLGLSSGLMVATSIWSLILPAIERAEDMGKLKFIPTAVGMILGGLFIAFIDFIVPRLFKRKNKPCQVKKSTKLFVAVTLHNIPEGLVVGLAFGNAIISGVYNSFLSALWLAIGIGIQNFPEGTAISIPIKEEEGSRRKGFLYGVLSGVIEPVMAVIAILLSTHIGFLMPWCLAFSAGAMFLVIMEELLPDMFTEGEGKIGTWGFMVGFILMMILDVALV